MKSSSTLSFQRRFDTIRRASEPIRPFRDPAALLDCLHRGSGSADGKNFILIALVEAAQGDGHASECALTLLLLALWPGLDAIRRRSIWRRIGSTDEMASEVLGRATEAVRDLDLNRVKRIAATILRNIERDMIRARQREVERANATSDIDPDEVPLDRAGQFPAPDEHLHNDIRTTIGADALLVIRVAIQGYSQAEVANELGLSEDAARKRYQRAKRKLRDAWSAPFQQMSRSEAASGFSRSSANGASHQPKAHAHAPH